MFSCSRSTRTPSRSIRPTLDVEQLDGTASATVTDSPMETTNPATDAPSTPPAPMVSWSTTAHVPRLVLPCSGMTTPSAASTPAEPADVTEMGRSSKHRWDMAFHMCKSSSDLNFSKQDQPLQKYLMCLPCVFHRKGSNITSEFHIPCVSHVNIFTCEILMCFTYEMSHLNIVTCEISHRIAFHTWKFTCEISHVKLHMCEVTCERSQDQICQLIEIRIINFV